MTDAAPKLFISYSWTSPEHEDWVVGLATEVRESGVDVILDKWDLKEGQDALAFMEKMVTDPKIKKVALIFDREYTEKADGRRGGVGTETQIISAEVYEKTDQSKFVAIVVERDEEGKACVPTYYKGRIYIDLCTPDLYARNFEQLLRWIHDKPQYQKPDIGAIPAYLDDERKTSLGTAHAFRRVVEAIRQDRPYCTGALNEYFSMFSQHLENFRIVKDSTEFDELVVNNIERFLPYRNEAIELFLALAQYRNTEESWGQLHRFFERLIPYYSRSVNDTSGWQDHDFDNFKFIIHELFLYAIASLLKHECFDAVSHLLQTLYFVEQRSQRGLDSMVPFTTFRESLQSLKDRNNRKELRRLSLHADLLEQRSKTSGFPFHHLMQADFTLFMRDCIDCLNPRRGQGWWPETVLYADRQHGAFEVFARSQSTRYFRRMAPILGISTKGEIEPVFEAFREDKLRIPSWQDESFNPAHLIGYDRLATLP